MTALHSAILWGEYFMTPSGNDGPYAARQFSIGRQFDIASYFASFDTTAAPHTEWLAASQRGQIILLGWKIRRTTPGITAAGILAGDFNAHIDQMINFLKTFPTQVVIRLGWEMNGNWMQYSPVYDGKDGPTSGFTSAQDFIDVWRFIVNRTRTTLGNPSNIKWYFCPNQNDTGTSPPLEAFYPGTSYVDIIGYDSYNGLNGLYMTPEQTFRGKTNNAQQDTYTRVCALHPTAPVWVGETGCVDLNDPKDTGNLAVGKSKADWYTAAFNLDLQTSSIPRLQAVCWFDHSGTRNWTHDTSAAAFDAFRAGFTQGTYTPAPAPVATDGQPPPWAGMVPRTSSFPEAHTWAGQPGARSHPDEHAALRHFLNLTMPQVGGFTALEGNTDGTAPALTVIASGTGTIAEPMIRLKPALNTLKNALTIRSKVDSYDTFILQTGGKIQWGSGATGADTALYRSGIGALKTDGALTVGGTLTAATNASPIMWPSNSTTAPAKPAAGQGVKLYSQADSLRVAVVGTPWAVVPALPQMHGRCLSDDPMTVTTNTVATAGVLYLRRVWVPDSRTLASAGCFVGVAGVTVTGAVMAAYSGSGALLGQTADLSTAFQTTGEKRNALTEASAGSLAVTPGYYYVALLVGSAGTLPHFGATGSLIPNWNMSGNGGRAIQSGTGQTAAPATITLGSAGTSKPIFMDLN